MEKEGKLYKILEDGLPEAKSKPISIGGQPFYSEGFVIEFIKKDGTTWIGNFRRGGTNLDTVYEYPEHNKVIIFAGGTIYVINPSLIEPEKTFGYNYEKILTTQNQQLVTFDDSDISVIKTTGEIWTCKDVSLKDGFRDVKVEGNIVTGFDVGPRAYSFGFQGQSFVLNLITKELKKEPGRLHNHAPKNKGKKRWWNLF